MINITKETDLKLVAKPQTEKKKPIGDTIYEVSDENQRLLNNAEEYWSALYSFREKRKRTRNYRMGLQWDDYITDPDTNEVITEEELISRNGKVPLKQNIIGQINNSFLGQWRSNPSKAIVISRSREKQKESEMMSVALEGVLQANQSEDLDADRVSEFIMSGFPIQKLSYAYWKELDRKDISIKNINPTNVFWNTDLADVRGRDLTMIGERIECTIDDIISTFAKTPEQEEAIREVYSGMSSADIFSAGFQNKDRFDNSSFQYAYDTNKVILIEVWYLEGRWMKQVHDWADGTYVTTDKTSDEIEAENQNRLMIGLEQGLSPEQIPLLESEDIYEKVWRVKYLSPMGHCFLEMDTPYLHDEHPYVFHAYPLIDGEIWGYLNEFIDQQRYINRLITLWDFVISASAKGLLMMPEDMIPDNMTPDEFAAEYRKFNGVIYYKQKPGSTVLPQQITASSSNVGIQDMLSLQLKLINDISGIQGAMQGQSPSSGTPASLYAMQIQNSSVNVLDKMKQFDSFLQKRNYKIIKLIKQFYDEPRYISVVGSSYSEDAKWFNPNDIKNTEFDTVITKGKDAPAYRMMMDDLLLQLLQGQFIDIEMYLENTSAPFSDKILESIKQRKEMVQQGQTPPPFPPELIQQLQSNPELLNNLK